ERLSSALTVPVADLERAIAEHELGGGFAHMIDCRGAGKDAVRDYVAGGRRSRRAHQLEVLSSRCRVRAYPCGRRKGRGRQRPRPRAGRNASQIRDSCSHLILLLLDVAIPPQTGRRGRGGRLAMRGVSDTTAIAGADPWRQGATHMRELAGWITLPRRAGARWCARSFVASPGAGRGGPRRPLRGVYPGPQGGRPGGAGYGRGVAPQRPAAVDPFPHLSAEPRMPAPPVGGAHDLAPHVIFLAPPRL